MVEFRVRNEVCYDFVNKQEFVCLVRFRCSFVEMM